MELTKGGPSHRIADWSTKPFQRRAKCSGNTTALSSHPRKTTGLDHVSIGPEPHLPRVSQARPPRHLNLGRKAMIEIVTALLAFISIGIFLAHAFDAYRLR